MNASEQYCASDLVVVRYVTSMDAVGGGRATRLTAETPSSTKGDVVVAGLVRASGDGKVDVGLVFEDERVRKAAMHGAAPGMSNAFRENACGAVRCAQATRNGATGRRGSAGAVNGTKPHGAENKPPVVAAATTTAAAAAGGSTSAAKGKKEESAAKQKDAGATKSNSLMSMFANAKPKSKGEETKTASAAKPTPAKMEPKKQATPVKPKAPTNADEAILAAEDDSDEDDSDDDFDGAKRKPRRKRAMAIDSEEEEDDEEEVAVMDIVDEPARTPTPKKKPSTPNKTPPSTKRKVPETNADDARDDVNDEEENDAPSEPNSRPQSASKKPKKEKAPSKKALLARRIKKTIEHMDEETGEEVMRTIWVDEFDNELNEDGTYKHPERVRTAA